MSPEKPLSLIVGVKYSATFARPDMPLYLATHIVDTVTARVPLAIIVLLDYCKRRSLPPYLQNRFVIPCEKVSISLWDAPGEQELLLWLEDALDQEIRHEVHEVQEEFCWGYTLELTRLRTADKVRKAAHAKDAQSKAYNLEAARLNNNLGLLVKAIVAAGLRLRLQMLLP
ncbi:hypothetical protein QJQ45_028339 [Haematococcus lacustris]|nr:hypothetical protein QJQ45_028339 [Haematococcus lacustris]